MTVVWVGDSGNAANGLAAPVAAAGLPEARRGIASGVTVSSPDPPALVGEPNVNGILVLAPDGAVQSADAAAEALLGCAPGELLGQRRPWLSPVGSPHEIVVLEGSNASRAVEIHCIEVPAAFEGVRLASVRDITVERRAYTALRDAEATYRGIFEDAVEGIFQTSPDGRYVLANPALARLYGYESPADLQAGVADIGSQLYLDPTRRQQFADAIRRDGKVTRFESEIRCKDGARIWISENARPVYDNNGDLLRYEGFVVDITQRRVAEMALAHRRKVEHLVTTISSQFVNVTSTQFAGVVADALQHLGGCLGADRCYLYTYDREGDLLEADQLWSRWPDLPVLPPRLGGVAAGHPHLVSKLRGGQVVAWYDLNEAPPEAAAEVGLLRSLAVTSVVLVPVQCGGQFLGLMGLDTVGREGEWLPDDVSLVRTLAEIIGGAMERCRAESERWQLEAQVRHAQKLESLGVLAGGIAHDFNNLLVGILGHAGLAADQLAAGHEARRCVEHVQTAALRAAELTGQLLAYSGKGHFITKPLDLNALVSEMSTLLETAVSRKAELACMLEPGIPPVEGDPAQLRQVVMNLITNASDALDDKAGRITLRTGVVSAGRTYLRAAWLDEDLPEGPYVWLEVTDTGCGMSLETRNRIFDPFFSTKFTGRGLGLAAVLGIVRSHRGAIKVYSEPGCGTTIRVLLPAGGRPLLAAGGSGRGASAAVSGTRVLVVDDDDAVRLVTAAILEEAGYQVLEAADGPTAIALLAQPDHAVQVVLLDLTMPLMSGDEVFLQLRETHPALRVVLTSGYTEQEATRRLIGQGLAGFVQKPYLSRDLLSVVAQAADA